MLDLDTLIKKIVYFHNLEDYNICLNTILENQKILNDNFPIFFVETLKLYYNMILDNYESINSNIIDCIIDGYSKIDDNNKYKIIINLTLLKYAYSKVQRDSNYKLSDEYQKIYNILTTSPHSLYILEKLIKKLGIDQVNRTNLHTNSRNIHLDTLVNIFDKIVLGMCLSYMIREDISE